MTQPRVIDDSEFKDAQRALERERLKIQKQQPIPKDLSSFREKLLALADGSMDLYGTSEGAVKGWENRERAAPDAPSDAKPEGGGQVRAKAGGEYGPNREWYPGGAFIATTEMPKQERRKIERMAAKDTELVDFGQRQKIEPGMIPIWRDVGTVLNRDFSINETYLDKAGYDDEYKTQIRGAASRAAKGERLFDIKEFPALARVSDVVRLIAADKPVPGDALDRAKKYSPDLGKYLVRAKTESGAE